VYLQTIIKFCVNWFLHLLTGSLTNILEIFDIPGNSDDFIVACVTKNSCLTLQIYLMSKLTTIKESKRFVTSFINWCSQMKPK
jgi:hypothetical protein